MEFVAGLSPKKKYKRSFFRDIAGEIWHRWFAWYPCVLYQQDGKSRMCWLQYIERRTSPDNYLATQRRPYQNAKSRSLGARRNRSRIDRNGAG